MFFIKAVHMGKKGTRGLRYRMLGQETYIANMSPNDSIMMEQKKNWFQNPYVMNFIVIE